MASQKHSLDEVISFGEQLLKTGDLDPVYIALWGAKLPQDQLKRLLIAYFCFYSLGAAAWLSEWDRFEYWDWMLRAAENDSSLGAELFKLPSVRWPRGAERRHFRGLKCVEAVKQLRDRLSPMHPDWLIGELIKGNVLRLPLDEVMERVQKWPLFGPWIAFKAADMLERLLNVSVVFPEDLAILYKEPRAALDLLTTPAQEANQILIKHFAKFKAPPSFNRDCGVAETETILCKWKSFLGGHYWVGKDIKEVRHGLVGWGETADKLLRHMPAEVGEGLFR